MYDEEQVAAIRRWPIEATEKGFGGPAHQSAVTAGQLARERPGADAGLLSTPRVLVREEALRHNISAMAAYCAAQDVSLFPHGKTTMAPQVLAAQLDGGRGWHHGRVDLAGPDIPAFRRAEHPARQRARG